MEVRDIENQPDTQEKSQKSKELSPLVLKSCAANQVHGLINHDYEAEARLLASPESQLNSSDFNKIKRTNSEY